MRHIYDLYDDEEDDEPFISIYIETPQELEQTDMKNLFTDPNKLSELLNDKASIHLKLGKGDVKLLKLPSIIGLAKKITYKTLNQRR